MDIIEFLYSQEWAVYKVDGAKRMFFGDTAFGPMWKNLPENVEVSNDLNLDSLSSVAEYMNANKLDGKSLLEMS